MAARRPTEKGERIRTMESSMIRINYRPRLAIAILLAGTMAFAATRQWQSGKLLDTEQQKVTEGSTTHYTTDSQKKSKNGKTDYSGNTTAHTTDNIDTYEVYTIQGPEKTYVAREKLLFPWSKPANVTVGAELKYAIDGRKLIILDEDQKEHKASIVKTSLNGGN
jgi:hypothetical protein